MKTCTKCKIEKEFTEFGKRKSTKSGYRSECKMCVKKYRLENSQHIKDYKKQYYLEHEENRKLYKLQNADKLREQNKIYRLKNKEKYNNWRKLNKDKVNNKANTYQKRKKVSDPLFKLICNIRNAISTSIRRQGYKKTSKTFEILGCSFEELVSHLEKQFTEGMTWKNYGVWHIDHIYPSSLALNEEHLIKLNHYTNLQPLWGIDNIKKGNRI